MIKGFMSGSKHFSLSVSEQKMHKPDLLSADIHILPDLTFKLVELSAHFRIKDYDHIQQLILFGLSEFIVKDE